MFAAGHTAPFYRRLPHVTWVDSMSLVWGLVKGAGRQRYPRTAPIQLDRREVHVKGFPAVSYSGLCIMHLLWRLPHIHASGKLGGIASIPPQKGQDLHLFHYVPDRLCCWQPTSESVKAFACLCTIVSNTVSDLRDHFGKCEHSYGHWKDLPLCEGEYPLWRTLSDFPEAADPAKRDVAPLRLVSWLGCHLSRNAQLLLDETIKSSQRLRQFILTRSLPWENFISRSLRTPSKPGIIFVMRSGVAHPREVVVGLTRNFLQRLPLPRLVHFIDLVLPQMDLSARLARPSAYPFQVVNWLEISRMLPPTADQCKPC